MHSTAYDLPSPPDTEPADDVRLDPDLPLGFDRRGALRLGFDTPVARIDGLGAGVERFIAALRAPVPRSRLAQVARRCGVPTQQIPALLSELEEALVPAAPRMRPGSTVPPPSEMPLNARRVRLIGDGLPAAALRSMLERSGCRVLPQRSARGPAAPADLVVFLSRFGWPVTGSQHALATGIPHLAVRFSDRSVEISPVVAGGGSPCITCLALHDRDRDPDQVDLAIQLRDTVPASETAETSELAAALVIRAIADARREVSPVSGGAQGLRLSCRRGAVLEIPSPRPARPHPSCDCHSFESRELSETVVDAPRRNAQRRGFAATGTDLSARSA